MGTFSANKSYQVPTVGSDISSWGNELNNTIGIIDNNLGGSSTIDVSASVDYTITSNQAQSMQILLVGTLTAAIKVIFPAVGGFYFIRNAATGAFTITVITSVSGSVGVIIPPGNSQLVFTGGTNVFAVSPGPGIINGNLTVVGTLTALAGGKYLGEIFAMGANQSFVPPGAILCFGQAVSRTTYAGLFGIIGTVWGVGDGSTTFNVPDLRGRALFGNDQMGGAPANVLTPGSMGTFATIGVTGGNEHLTSHAHGVIDPGHTHVVTDPGHYHSVTDPTHVHSIYDPAHAHNITDPQHRHGISPNYQSVSGAISFGAGAGNFGTGTGLTGYASTGISIQGATTGVTVVGGLTGITINTSPTNISNNAATTGISVVAAGTGGSLNIPPAAVVNWYIYAGV